MISCVFTVGRLCARQYARASQARRQECSYQGNSIIIASTVSMAHSGESGKRNRRRFHGGGVKGSISGRTYTEVLAKGLGIQRVWDTCPSE